MAIKSRSWSVPTKVMWKVWYWKLGNYGVAVGCYDGFRGEVTWNVNGLICNRLNKSLRKKMDKQSMIDNERLPFNRLPKGFSYWKLSQVKKDWYTNTDTNTGTGVNAAGQH